MSWGTQKYTSVVNCGHWWEGVEGSEMENKAFEEGVWDKKREEKYQEGSKENGLDLRRLDILIYNALKMYTP